MENKQKRICCLCMVHIYGKDKVPRFGGYQLFSSDPWRLTSRGDGRFYTTLYKTEGESYQEAMKTMEETVKALAERMPFWETVWPWVDPSEEAHKARYDMQKMLASPYGDLRIVDTDRYLRPATEAERLMSDESINAGGNGHIMYADGPTAYVDRD